MTEEKKLFDTGPWYKNDRKNFLWRFVNTDTDTRHAANEGRSGLGPNRPRQRSSRRPNDRPSDPRGGNIIKLFFFAENKLECIWLPSFSKLQYLGLRTGAYSETLDSRKNIFRKNTLSYWQSKGLITLTSEVNVINFFLCCWCTWKIRLSVCCWYV